MEKECGVRIRVESSVNASRTISFIFYFKKLYLFPLYTYTRAGNKVDSTVHCFRIRDDNFYCLHLAYPTQKQFGVVALCRTGLRKAGVAWPESRLLRVMLFYLE